MQEKKPSRTGWLPSILIVLLCCAIAWLGANWIVPEKTLMLDEGVELPAYAGQDCVPLDEGAAYYDGTLLYALATRNCFGVFATNVIGERHCINHKRIPPRERRT